MLCGPPGTKVSELSFEIQLFFIEQMYFWMPYATWRPFCHDFNVLNIDDKHILDKYFTKDRLPKVEYNYGEVTWAPWCLKSTATISLTYYLGRYKKSTLSISDCFLGFRRWSAFSSNIGFQIQIQILYLPLLGHRPIQAYTYTYKYQTKMQIQ